MGHSPSEAPLDSRQSGTPPSIYARFLREDILAEGGRLLFSLLNAFVSAGYTLTLHASLLRKDLGKYGQRALALDGLSVSETEPATTEDILYLFDEEDRATGRRRWRKKVQVRFDIFSAYWFTRPIFLPYPIHPVHTGPDLEQRLTQCRAAPKRMRIFFAGDTEGYTRNRIRYPDPKLPRQEIIRTIATGMRPGTLMAQGSDEEFRHLLERDYANLFVIAERFRINDRQWLQTLARSDFFLCPPGYVMPMCHNAIEAMAVGTIPIINYPEWFSPHLQHMENCIVFSGGADLIGKLETVLAMRCDEIAEMRLRVLDYYERHLLPCTFVRKIETASRQKVVVLMITDANVVQRASALGPHSVLMRGATGTDGGRWMDRLLAVCA